MVRFRNRLARTLISLWPTEVGLWRLMDYTPSFDRGEPPVTVRLRSLPLKFRFKPQTYVGRFIYYRGMYEEGQVHLLRSLLQDGMTFVDVGANAGLYSVIASHAVGPTGRVIAIEPQPELAATVAENVALNAQDNVTIKTLALGASAGTARLFQVSAINDGEATLQVCTSEKTYGEPISVRVETLSNLLEECGVRFVDGMKIDVEGNELAVLEGFTEWLRDHPPQFIFVECIDEHLRRFGATTQDVLSFLQAYQYQILCLFRGHWRPIKSREDHARCGNSPDVLAIRRSAATRSKLCGLLP